MKRYFRTKDGKIYDTNRYAYVWTTPKGIGLSVCANYDIFILNSLIEKQSDKLTCLCDRYVLHHTDVIFLNKEHTKYRFENEPNNWHDITDTEIRVGIYGAIWTDKGLIYKAKLNEKGDLELL